MRIDNKIAAVVSVLKYRKKSAVGHEDSNSKQEVQKKPSYFAQAKSWADDMYTEAVISRDRYKMAFYWTAGIASLLVICVMMLVPAQHTELVVVHHYNDGTIWVEPTHQKYAPINQAQTQSEIVRYVTNRESYNSSSYAEQYSLITLLSNSKVAKEYSSVQNADNKSSPINVLGNKGYRRVHVDNIIFIDNENLNKNKNAKTKHYNLAQIDYRITDYNNTTGAGKSIPLTALISWKYRGTPKNPEDIWRNWDGFTVTRFTISQRNVK